VVVCWVMGRWGTPGGCPQRPRLPRGRPRSTLRRCTGSRPGSGWVRVEPVRSRPRTPLHRPSARIGQLHSQEWVWSLRASDGMRRWSRAGIAALPVGNGAFRSAECQRPRVGGDPPSAMSTGRLRSVTGRPPPASQPGRLPGAFLFSDGETRLGAGFPLRCFQRFAHPDVATQRCRLPDNWHTSGPSSPVLSY
jgi:hypothetical protein